MIDVPDNVWDNENTQNHSSNPNTRQSSDPPLLACIRIKVVYNNLWVESAGNGNIATARQKALDVIAETQNIYNNKYAVENRLGTSISFNLVTGKSTCKS